MIVGRLFSFSNGPFSGDFGSFSGGGATQFWSQMFSTLGRARCSKCGGLCRSLERRVFLLVLLLKALAWGDWFVAHILFRGFLGVPFLEKKLGVHPDLTWWLLGTTWRESCRSIDADGEVMSNLVSALMTTVVFVRWSKTYFYFEYIYNMNEKNKWATKFQQKIIRQTEPLKINTLFYSTEGHQSAVFKANFMSVFKTNLILSNVIFVQCLVSFPVEALWWDKRS